VNRLPVLILYGIDTKIHPWEVTDTRALVTRAEQALTELGWNTLRVEVNHDLESALKPYLPEEWVVLNLCEGSRCRGRLSRDARLHLYGFDQSGSRRDAIQGCDETPV
jgi:hypothetical protein